MSIQAKVNELKSIQNELSILRKRSSTLRQKSKQIEQEIEDYLDAKDQPGLKYKGMAIIRETALVKNRGSKRGLMERRSDSEFTSE